MEVMVGELYIPSWVIYTFLYFIIGGLWSFASWYNDWEVTIDLTDYPLWPFYIFLWLPMIVFITIGLLTWGIGVVLIKETIMPKVRHRYYQFKYRREVNKFKPKYGYDK